MPTSVETTGFHGTSREAKEKILQENFKPSKGDNHWLGRGVYFFEDGIGVSGIKCATEWAESEAWCNDTKQYTYRVLSVIEAKIKITKLWDLTTEDGLQAFNYGRVRILEKFRNRRPESKGFDNEVITAVGEMMKFDAIRAWFYIKTDQIDRRKKIQSGIPNTRVLCVADPDNCISLDEIKMVVEQYIT